MGDVVRAWRDMTRATESPVWYWSTEAVLKLLAIGDGLATEVERLRLEVEEGD